MYKKIIQKLVFPLYEFTFQKRVQRNIKFLVGSQYWSRDELENFQKEKLKEIIEFSYNNIPFYKRKYDKLGIIPNDVKDLSDLKKLPVITKEELKNTEESALIPQVKIKYNNYSTSGSTGEPFNYRVSNEAQDMLNAAAIRGWMWMGYELGDPYIKISPKKRSLLKKLQDLIFRSKNEVLNPLSQEDIGRIVNKVIKTRPTIIRSNPDPLYILSNYIRKHNIKIDFLRGISSTGAVLSKEYRNQIENVFNTKIFDFYSCEGSAVYCECPTHNCFHNADELSINEILKKDTGSNEGVLITTNLWNKAFPFIRYKTGDIVTEYENNCKCGRGLSSIHKIEGRENDILVTSDGKLLVSHFFSSFFYKLKGIEQFQIVQISYSKIIIKLKINNEYDNQVERKINNFFSKNLPDSMIFDIQIVDEILLLKNYKHKYFVKDF